MDNDQCFLDSPDDGLDNEALALRCLKEEDEDEYEEEELEPEEVYKPDNYVIIETEGRISSRSNCTFCVKSRPCTVCLYVAIVLLVLSCTVTLVLVGLLVVVPYQRSRDFVVATCSPERTIQYPTDRRCSCGKGCSSQYPCVQIMVNVYPDVRDDIDRVPRSAVLSEDETIIDLKVLLHMYIT